MVYIQNLEMKYSPCMSSTFKQIFNLIGKEKLFIKVETVVKHSPTTKPMELIYTL